MNLAEPNEQWRESVPFRHGMFGAAKFNHTTELTTPSWRQSRVLFIPSIRLSFYSKSFIQKEDKARDCCCALSGSCRLVPIFCGQHGSFHRLLPLQKLV